MKDFLKFRNKIRNNLSNFRNKYMKNFSILTKFFPTGKLFSIENNKIIIDIDKSFEIFEVVKDIFLKFPTEELILLG